MKDLPPEFRHYAKTEGISWEKITSSTGKKGEKTEQETFEGFTDAVIEAASKESMKNHPSSQMIAMGVEACLMRGRLAEALFLSTESENISVLSLRAIVLFALSDVDGLRRVLASLEASVTDDSAASDKVRLSIVKVLTAAGERDTSVIQCVMEFDSLLEAYPEQVEEPLVETMFALYVVGTLLREVGQTSRASRIADTLDEMADKRENRMMMALAENLRGNISNLQGDYVSAEEHYVRFKEISEELSFNLGIGMALNNLGTLKLHSLRLEEALDYLREALVYMDMETGRLVTLSNLGEIAVLLGRYKEAEQYLKEAVRLETKTGKGIVEAYAWTAIMHARQGRHSEAKKYLQQASKLAENSDKPLKIGVYLMTQGVCEASMGKTDQAAALLEKALRISIENSLFELLVSVELELAKIYVQAHSRTGAADFLARAAYHLDDIIQIGKEQNLQSLYAHCLVLRGDVMALAGKKLEAKGDLERAASVASFVKDTRIEQEARTRIQKLAGPMPSESLVSESSLSSSLDRASAFRSVGQIKEVPRPQLRALVVMSRDSGLPEYVHQFEASIDMDSTLVSGFISAISSFASQLMGDVGLLRSINHEGFVLMMEYTSSRIVTLIADEESFDIRYLLRHFAERFEATFPPRPNRDMVEPDEFAGAEALIKEIFS